jgi:glycosyltransferase involved in cell wall biosynthesis
VSESSRYRGDRGAEAETTPTLLGFVDMRTDEFVAPLEAVGEAEHVYSFEGANAVTKFARGLVRGARTLRDSDVDALVLYNGTGVLGVVSVILRLVYGVPLVLRVNGDTFQNHRDRIRTLREDGAYGRAIVFYVYHLLTRLTYWVATAYLPVSENMRRRLASDPTYPDRPAETVYNSVDAARFGEASPTQRVGGVDISEKRVLLTVTNLDYEGKYRGVADLVDELATLLDEREVLALVVAGDGAYFDSLAARVEEAAPERVRDRIVLAGYVNEVPRLFAAADLFVYRSYADAYPNVVLEAQAAGLAVIANAGYGVEEQITDGETGILVPEDADGASAEATRTLLADDGLRRQVARNAASKVRSENTDEEVGREMLRAVARLVE